MKEIEFNNRDYSLVGYHKIDIPPTLFMSNFGGGKISDCIDISLMMDEIRLKEEVNDWLLENIVSFPLYGISFSNVYKYGGVVSEQLCFTLYFTNIDDVVAFKLRWL